MVRAQGGDLDAFGELYAAYRDRVFCLARKYLPAHAEDITQDVFVKAMTKLDSWHDQGKEPLAWLNTITINMCLTKAKSAHERRSRPISFDDHLEVPRPDPAPGPEQQAVAALTRGELLDAMAALTVDHRTVLVLRFFEEMPVREIANLLGIPLTAAKMRLVRARAVLAKVLAGRGLGDA